MTLIQGLTAAMPILSVLFFLVILRLPASGAIDTIRQGFTHISPDRRVQTVIVGWLFVAFLEGASGAVSYGAVGTPVIVGLGQGLDNPTQADVLQIAITASQIDLWVASFLPLIMVLILTPKEVWLFESDTTLYSARHLDKKAPGLVKNETCTPSLPCLVSEPNQHPRISLIRAWLPYLLVAILLVLSRLDFLPFKSWLMSVQFVFSQLLDTDISAQFTPLYLIGSLFILVALITLVLHKVPLNQAQTAGFTSIKSLTPTLIALLTSVPMVRIFLHSEVNGAELMSMPMKLAVMAANHFQSNWALAAPFVGALGSFIAGSATFSNMMFAQFQAATASATDLPTHWILALQMLGANAGNMICVVNVVAAASVVNLSGKEGHIIRLTLWPMLFYAFSVGLIGWIMTR